MAERDYCRSTRSRRTVNARGMVHRVFDRLANVAHGGTTVEAEASGCPKHPETDIAGVAQRHLSTVPTAHDRNHD